VVWPRFEGRREQQLDPRRLGSRFVQAELTFEDGDKLVILDSSIRATSCSFQSGSSRGFHDLWRSCLVLGDAGYGAERTVAIYVFSKHYCMVQPDQRRRSFPPGNEVGYPLARCALFLHVHQCKPLLVLL
jgi:hypothetical protein